MYKFKVNASDLVDLRSALVGGGGLISRRRR
jgi:hypothetical protein